MEQTPFLIKYPNGLASKCLINITNKLLYGQEIHNEGTVTIEGWFKKLMSFIKTNVGAL